MEIYANIFILLFVILGRSSMLIEACRDHYHAPPPNTRGTTIHDVTKFGAVGNGKTDDSKAFASAWKAACGSGSENAQITVPIGKTFLVSMAQFEGPCKSRSITFQILGNIVAPLKSAWKSKNTEAWLRFHRVERLSVVGEGRGLIDGRGQSWWKHGDGYSHMPPTTLHFSHCNNLQVSGLRHNNSQKNHVSINQCDTATISNLHITAPSKSPNTDGIDISASTNIVIRNSTIETGDDCIAINGGTSNVLISDIACGPGHGISIGSLGRNGKHEEVSGIQVINSVFKETTNGVRIKTWQGGSGYARNISFSKITFINAKNPVLIDQYYCPHKKCADQASAVKISNVRYTGLHGTTNGKAAAINFSCSKTVPCTDIIVQDVDIRPSDSKLSTSAQCINAHGKARTSNPALNCLRK